MAETCTHLGDLATDAAPTGPGCYECTLIGSTWVHLRRCVECGHVGCCDNSPNRHATHHYDETTHPLIQSYEPGEDWLWCYVDELMFEVAGQGPSPSHP
jgi:uncharacterized UBP type Zn finger protein